MDVIVSTRLEEVQHFLEQDDVYGYCGVDVKQLATPIVQSILLDVKNMQVVSKSWESQDVRKVDDIAYANAYSNKKYRELSLMVALLQRRINIDDIPGCLWCIREANVMLIRH